MSSTLIYFICLVRHRRTRCSAVVKAVTVVQVVTVQWLKLPAWKVGDRGLVPHSGIQVSKKQNVSSPLTCKYSILPPWPRYMVLGIRPSRLEFRLDDRVISSSSGGSSLHATAPGPSPPQRGAHTKYNYIKFWWDENKSDPWQVWYNYIL